MPWLWPLSVMTSFLASSVDDDRGQPQRHHRAEQREDPQASGCGRRAAAGRSRRCRRCRAACRRCPRTASMNATSRPPAPALCAARPGGLPVWAILMMAFSLSLSSGPVRSVPSARGHQRHGQRSRWCRPGSTPAGRAGPRRRRPGRRSSPGRRRSWPCRRRSGRPPAGRPGSPGCSGHGDELVRLVGDLGRLRATPAGTRSCRSSGRRLSLLW